MNNRVFLLSTELPAGLVGDALEKYLQATYPGKNVVIQEDISLFGNLLPELLKKIIVSSEVVVLSVRLNSWFYKEYIAEFYEATCDLPVSVGEMVSEMKASSSVIIERRTDIGDMVKSTMSKCSLMEGDEYKIVFSNCATCVVSKSDPAAMYTRKYNYTSELVNMLEYYHPSLFSEYKILKKRYLCMLHNPKYASKRIVARYNKETITRRDDEWTADDVIRAFTIAYVHNDISHTTKSSPNFAVVKGCSSLLFDLNRDSIMEAITKETGAMMTTIGSDKRALIIV